MKVRTPSELNTELSRLAQQEGQPAITFFMNALKLRQLLFVSHSVEGGTFTPMVVQSTFLHTVRTGLRDDGVRTYMLPLLSETSQCDDNHLITHLHKAVEEARVREEKTKTEKKASTAKVNSVQSSPELRAIMKKLEENQDQIKVMQE